MATSSTHSDLPNDETSEQDKQCSLRSCYSQASGHGLYWEGPLCAEHLKKDEKQFQLQLSAIKIETDESLAKVSQLIKNTRGAQFDLESDRADAADMFDSIMERVKQCRENVIGRLDSKIADLEQSLRSLSSVEQLSAEISAADAEGNALSSFRLRKEFNMSMVDAPNTNPWANIVDRGVQQVERLQQAVNTLAAEAEESDDDLQSRWKSAVCVAKRTQCCADSDWIFTDVITNTDGLFCSKQSVSTTLQDGFYALPHSCILSVANGFTMNDWWFRIDSMDLNDVICQLQIPNNGIKLISGRLVNHIKRIFLLGKDEEILSMSIIMTDLTGAKLQTVQDVQFGEKPSLTHDMEKLYILSDGYVNCHSLESLELQQSLKLPDHVKDARSVTVSGRSFILATPSAVHRMSLSTGDTVKLMDCPDRLVTAIGLDFLPCVALLWALLKFSAAWVGVLENSTPNSLVSSCSAENVVAVLI
ncbi:hypothetical protein BOX15_Mlig017407g1 [Macrostomum lignano]|uniref:Uncharacterized protein n=1 Tax=Macrostomum lignano TaxID=282301 RepID=A0A267GNP3_9PLAT|nr:hypothetical protein BOX15_Mlig017407g1 [Macrostomum lignano]